VSQSILARKRNELNSTPKQYYHTQAYGQECGFRDKVFDLQAVPSPRISGRMYPNGKFSMGFVPKPKMSALDRRHKEYEDAHPLMSANRWDKDEGIVRSYYRSGDPGQCGILSPLGLSKVPNPHRAVRPKKNFVSVHGKNQIEQGSYIMKMRKVRCGFYTFTVPTFLPSAYPLVFEQWGEVVRVFMQRLKRHLQRAGVPDYRIWVSEFQSKRSLTVGCPVPHLHVIMPCYFPNSREFIFPAHCLRLLWKETFQSVLGESVFGADWGASIDCQVVRKDVGSYLNKYLSKGAGLDDPDSPLAVSSTQRRWQLWGTSKYLRDQLKLATIHIGDDFAELLFLAMSGTAPHELLQVSRFYAIPLVTKDGQTITIGWSGYCNFKMFANGQFGFVSNK